MSFAAAAATIVAAVRGDDLAWAVFLVAWTIVEATGLIIRAIEDSAR